MNFTSFKESVRQEIIKRIGNDSRVRINNVRKNNGIVLSGLTITEKDGNIFPTVYLNDYYTDYIGGRIAFSDVIDGVLNTYNRNKVGQYVDMRYFLNFDEVKHRIVYKLVNTEKNKELLEDVPHMEFMDLSVVFQCLVTQEEVGAAFILIHNVHMKLWDVSTAELYQIAEKNTPRLLPCEIKSMYQVLLEIMRDENSEQFDEEECTKNLPDDIPMYVLTNQSRIDGATCIMYPDVLRNFAETIDSSFYIIPSSIHEVLILPAETFEDSEEILCMIKEINDTQVGEEDILSYSLYCYNRVADSLSTLS